MLLQLSTRVASDMLHMLRHMPLVARLMAGVPGICGDLLQVLVIQCSECLGYHGVQSCDCIAAVLLYTECTALPPKPCPSGLHILVVA